MKVKQGNIKIQIHYSLHYKTTPFKNKVVLLDRLSLGH